MQQYLCLFCLFHHFQYRALHFDYLCKGNICCFYYGSVYYISIKLKLKFETSTILYTFSIFTLAFIVIISKVLRLGAGCYFFYSPKSLFNIFWWLPPEQNPINPYTSANVLCTAQNISAYCFPPGCARALPFTLVPLPLLKNGYLLALT